MKAPTKNATKANTKVMSRDELRACMDQQDRLLQQRSNVEQGQAQLDRQRGEVEALDADLARKRAALDPADAAGAQALAGDVSRRDEIVAQYNARLRALRDEAGEFDRQRQQWVERCANKDFDEMDEAAIKKERRRAAATRGSP